MSRIVATPSGGPDASYDPLQGDLSQSSFHSSSTRSLLESQIDGLTTHFLEQASDPILLTAMVAGGFAYRLGRIGIMGMGASPLLRPLSVVGGLGLEAGSFEIAHRALLSVSSPDSTQLWSGSGPNGLPQGFVSSFIAFATLKGMGLLSQGQNLVFQHALQSAALVAAHQGSAALGIIPRPEGNLGAQFLDAEATHLQMMAGAALSHRLMPEIPIFERGLDLAIMNGRAPTLRGRPSLFEPSFVVATGMDPFGERPVQKGNHPPFHSAHVFSVKNTSSGEEGSSLSTSAEQAQELKLRFTPQFPPTGDPRIYSDEIIERVLGTPSEIPHFHERLLEALAQVPERGTLSQRHTVDAIRRTFQFGSLHSSTGTIENALLELLISQLLHEENLNRRHQGFTALFGAMEQGLTRPALELLFSHHGSLKDWRSDVFPRFPGVFIKRFEETLVRELEDYSLRQKVQILNFLHQEFSENPLKAQRALEFFGEAARSGRYDFSHIEPAFQYARFTPFGRLILRRMLLIFATEDIPAKLEELKPSPDHNTLALAREAAHHGIDLPTLALTINGTRHTAYLRDQRLALKWVAIMAEMAGYFELSLEERQLYRRRFHHTIQNFLRSGALLTPERLMDLIHTNATPQTQRIRERWAKGDFEVRFATDAEMDALLSRWKQVGREISHLFYRGEGDRPHQVLLRLFSAPNPPLSPDSYARQTQLIHHARGLIHETEHWSHFTGQFEGIEAGGKSFPILQLGREARLATEIMALLSDNAWMTRNVTETDWEIARRMGLNLPLYYRAIADHGYFGRTNHRLAKILF